MHEIGEHLKQKLNTTKEYAKRASEKLLFGSTKAKLEGLWAISDLKELQQTDALTLPPELLEHISQKRLLTHRTGIEYASDIDYQNGAIVLLKERIGENSAYTIEPHESAYVNIRRSLKELYFGESALIFFHTHPGWPVENGPMRVPLDNGREIIVPAQTASKHADFMSSLFSPEDINLFFNDKRIIKSMLLASPTKTIYICPKEVRSNFDLTNFRAERKEYEHEINCLAAASELLSLQIEPDEILAVLRKRVGKRMQKLREIYENVQTTKDLELLAEEVLVTFCEKNGLAGIRFRRPQLSCFKKTFFKN